MPSRPAHPASRHARHGVALVIVLAFVLLLTGLVLAFFSRALSERQISDSSASQVKVDALARGAVNTVIGDFQQEIAAGSSAYPLPSPTSSQGGSTIFVPGINAKNGTTTSNAATMVPAPVFPSPTPAFSTTNPPSGLENLVKQSAGGQPFYSNPTPAAPTGASYDIGSFPPSKRAAKSVTGTGATGDNSTNKPSLSGRFVSPARWNKPLLLPATSATNLAPVINGGTFVPPDWVLLARDGSNPTTWNQNLTTSTNAATAVVGRFAYNIYDEGGLLDANVAGYPGTTGVTPSTATAGQFGLYKNALAYADLTQLTDTTGNPLLTQAQIDALVGWRNSASTNAPGAFPSPAFTDDSRSKYYDSVLSNPVGFLTMGGAKLSASKQSDRMFPGRQTLINLLQSIATLTGGDTAKANAALRYLGTFDRALDQPSFIKAQSIKGRDVNGNIILGYDPSAPAVFNPNQGGTNAVGLDDVINPSFLAVRVKTALAQGRFDGSNLTVGEALVKKRFPLNRLAWLTYVGPITFDGTNYNPKLSPTYVSTLKTYGFTDTFLLQGTPTNVQKSFGLNWSTNHWLYNVSGHGGSGAAIYKLSSPADNTDVVRASPGREPDFFELLKASINVGSLAKAATNPSPTTLPLGTGGSYQSQYVDDTSIDGAIMQIGANIIDQSDLDGYPTWINFVNDPGTPGGKDIYGIENLPYLAGVSHALVKVKQADPTIDSSTTYIKNTGVGALLQCPELWNPHDYNTNNVNGTLGVVGPTSFRVYAQSGNVANVNSGMQLVGYSRTGVSNGHNHQFANTTKSPGYYTVYGFSTSPEPRSLSKDNTELGFTVSRDSGGMARFREPTILFQLTASGGYVTSSPARGNFGTIGSTPGFFASNGGNAFKSDVDSGVIGVPPGANSGYVGFYLGAVPLYWSDNQTGNSPYTWLDNIGVPSPVDVRYFLQYQDASGTWLTYDEKDRTLGGSGSYSENATLSAGGDKSASSVGWSSFFYPRVVSTPNGQWDSCYEVMDPRTSRFHMMKLTSGNARYWAYPPYSAPYTGDAPGTATRAATAYKVGFANGWINSGAGITLPLRNGTNDGSSLYCPVGLFPTSMGWNPGSVAAGTAQSFVTYNNLTLGNVSGLHICRPGMFSQNNPYLRRNDRPMGDTDDSSQMDGFGTVGGGQSNAAQTYSDPDGVIRRATAGLVPYNAGGVPATSNIGLPMTAANTMGTTRLQQGDSRPLILNHPFRTVGELAYTFSGTPWKNLNFTMAESGDSALLDVFCINSADDPNSVVAGKVNLNTRQVPVLQAIVAGAYRDEWNPATGPIGGNLPAAIAKGLVTRTTSTAAGKGPLQNVSELVGRFVSKTDANADTAIGGIATAMKGATISPRSYDGFSADLVNNIPPLAPASSPAPPSGILAPSADPNFSIPRFANATVRALAASGQTRVWNLMIDVIAQTGRYPQTANTLDKFAVEAEQRYWVHVAIDRFTGQVIDKQVEVIKE